jgi:hypothetical protein
MRDEVDVVELGKHAGASEAPVDGGEQGTLQAGKLGGYGPADARVVYLGTERVAV